MSISIVEKTVKDAQIPVTGSTTLWDDMITGFGLRITPRARRASS
jgi:hypothetical protein